MDKQKQQQAYENYVKKKTPVHNLPMNMAKAFVAGGDLKRNPDRLQYLSPNRKMGRRGDACSHYRLRKFCRGAGH